MEKFRSIDELRELSRGGKNMDGSFSHIVGFLGPSIDTDYLVYAALTKEELEEVDNYFNIHCEGLSCETDAIKEIMPERLVVLSKREWVVYSQALRGMM